MVGYSRGGVVVGIGAQETAPCLLMVGENESCSATSCCRPENSDSGKAKGPEPLGSSPFRWCEWGDLNSMNDVSFNHGVAETLTLPGCAVLLSHVVLVFSRILLPICYQRPSPCSVAYVRESNGSAGSGCSVLDASPGYSEMVRSYSEVVPGWCAGL